DDLPTTRLSGDAHDTPFVYRAVLLPLFEEGELRIGQIVIIDDEIPNLDIGCKLGNQG
ncbi:hypothetical protein A2U01_0113279, partial [Trifolium medium]|nr:hypothetical protein [Trifolium medium]